jgi:hypothetical protein
MIANRDVKFVHFGDGQLGVLSICVEATGSISVEAIEWDSEDEEGTPDATSLIVKSIDFRKVKSYRGINIGHLSECEETTYDS